MSMSTNSCAIVRIFLIEIMQNLLFELRENRGASIRAFYSTNYLTVSD